MRLDEWLRMAESRLKVDSPSLEAQLLAAHVLRVDRAWLHAHPEGEINELAAEALLQRREGGEPLAYILGWREFYGRQFGVDSSVLIPRHETEILVEAALALGPRKAHPNGSDSRPDGGEWSVLDLGTGSGILAVTLKLERPHWTVTGVDVSPEALATASANSRFLDAQVRWIVSDGFAALLGETFDMIVSNPPYIGPDEPLPPEIHEFEPYVALFAENKGLAFYEYLAEHAPAHLSDNGLLMMEVGHTQAETVTKLFESFGWSHVETRQDLSGVERVVVFGYKY